MCVDGGGDRWAGVTEHRGDCATSIPSAIISEAAEWRRTWGWHAAGWSARDDPTASGSTTSRRSSTRSNGSGTPITGPTTCAPSSLGTTGSTTSCSYGHHGYVRGGGGTPATPPSTSRCDWFGVGDLVARRRRRHIARVSGDPPVAPTIEGGRQRRDARRMGEPRVWLGGGRRANHSGGTTRMRFASLRTNHRRLCGDVSLTGGSAGGRRAVSAADGRAQVPRPLARGAKAVRETERRVPPPGGRRRSSQLPGRRPVAPGRRPT